MNPTFNLASEARQIAATTKLGMAVNTILMAAKIAVGAAVGSLALIADGFNSLTNMITDVAVLVGARLGALPADDNHPYGHGKIETFVAGVVEIGVLTVGGGIIYSAVVSLIEGPEIPTNGWAVVGVSAVTIICKEWLFHRTSKVAESCRSAALKAKAWDHRSDVAVSTVVLAGGVGSLYHWPYGDVIAGMVVGVVIVGVGARLAFETLIELTEGWAGSETVGKITTVFSANQDVRGWHRLRTRRIGRELFMDVHIMVDPKISVEESHHIVRRLEDDVQAALDWPISLTVHIDPDNEEIRSVRKSFGDQTLK